MNGSEVLDSHLRVWSDEELRTFVLNNKCCEGGRKKKLAPAVGSATGTSRTTNKL